MKGFLSRGSVLYQCRSHKLIQKADSTEPEQRWRFGVKWPSSLDGTDPGTQSFFWNIRELLNRQGHKSYEITENTKRAEEFAGLSNPG